MRKTYPGFVEPVPPCWPRLDPGPWLRSKQATAAPPPPDPLVLDLNGDGIQTIAIDAGTYFDHNGDGFAELTGWVDSGDGLLVMDRNGDGFINDGKELFGDQTILGDGTRAANGFEALAELDNNEDGIIDASDAGFSQLGVMTASTENRYEIHSLDELGIKFINLDWTTTGIIDSQGNTQFSSSSYERNDGTSGVIAEYGFVTDRSSAAPVQWYFTSEDIAGLPDLRGSGNVYHLHQAMARDTIGHLESLLEQFISTADPNSRNGVMQEILFKWAGSDGVHPNSRGPNIDAR